MVKVIQLFCHNVVVHFGTVPKQFQNFLELKQVFVLQKLEKLTHMGGKW
jgi:hypothetical protein